MFYFNNEQFTQDETQHITCYKLAYKEPEISLGSGWRLHKKRENKDEEKITGFTQQQIATLRCQ